MTKEPTEAFGNPTPIGLMGLALGCAALAPAELGWTKIMDPKIWLWMMMTAGVLQIYAGIIDLVNKNILGATAFTVYGTLWLIAGWQLGVQAFGDPMVKVYIYIFFLCFTAFMTIGFMMVSLNLTIVFVEFIIIFTLEILAGFYPDFHHLASRLVGILHVMAGFQVLWAAAGGVINNTLGRNIFNQGEPPLKKKETHESTNDFASIRKHIDLREKIIGMMYRHWEGHGWEWISTQEVCDKLGRAPEELAPDFWYLYQKAYVALDEERYKADPEAPKMVRLTAGGADYYGELQMSKFKF